MKPGFGLGVLGLIGGAAYVFRRQIAAKLPADSASSGFDRNDIRIALRNEAHSGGFDSDWFDAISYVESRWKLDAFNPADPSGAYGPMQMLGSTASRLGYADPSLFQKNPHIAGQAAVAYFLSANPQTLADAAAYWNAGVASFATLPSDHPTVVNYWPQILDAYGYVLENPPT